MMGEGSSLSLLYLLSWEVEGSGGEGRGRGVKRDGRARMPKRKGQ